MIYVINGDMMCPYMTLADETEIVHSQVMEHKSRLIKLISGLENIMKYHQEFFYSLESLQYIINIIKFIVFKIFDYKN